MEHLRVVVVSWVDGDSSMIWIMKHPDTGEYGLKEELAENGDDEGVIVGVYEPYEDELHGCDRSAVKPSWIAPIGF